MEGKKKTDLKTIPNVGKATERDLAAMGYSCAEDLKGKRAEELYAEECALRGETLDRCQLYLLRAVEYFVNAENPDRKKCKWWFWKDEYALPAPCGAVCAECGRFPEQCGGCRTIRGRVYWLEFTGGTQVVVQYPQAAPTEQIREQIKDKLGIEAAVQNYGTARDVMIRLPMKEGESSGQQAQELMDVLHATEPGVKLLNNEFVGPQVGEELAADGGTALLLVVIGIMIYLAFRFEWKFAVAAIIANLHDVVIVIGIFAVMQWEFSLPVLAAVLAVLGYSVNESVIIFDRVREHFRKMRRAETVEVINSAITATISRTVITHGSTLAMTLAMFFFGGPALHYFALALTIGILLGVYSSVFVAAAIAMYLGVKREDLVKPIKKDEVQEMVP